MTDIPHPVGWILHFILHGRTQQFVLFSHRNRCFVLSSLTNVLHRKPSNDEHSNACGHTSHPTTQGDNTC